MQYTTGHTRASSERLLDTHVRTIMRAGVIALPEDASVRQVQRALVSHGVHAILITAAPGGEPIGWATSRGVLSRALADTPLMPATTAVTDPVESIAPAASAEEALSRLLETGAARLLVRRRPGGPPEGVLSETDLLRLITPS